MKEYQKIETLFAFDPQTHLYKREYYNPIVKYLSPLPWLVSEKVDGTNIRVHYDGHRVEWSGRTDKAQLPKEVSALLEETFGESEIVFEQTFGDKDVFLFMECYGGKIQGGAYGGKERLIGFDVMVNGIYLQRDTINDIFGKFNIPVVRMWEVGCIDEAIAWVNENGVSPYCEKGTTPIEGLVCVPLLRLYDHQGNRVCVKIKKRDLMKMEFPFTKE